MRLCPPVPSLLPREVLEGGIDVDGIHFPAGSVVGVPIYALQHNPEYHPDPFSYNPERWIAGNDEGDDEKGNSRWNAERVRLAQSAFCPFSVGPRGCIGKGVAYLELSIALARVLWLYDLRLVYAGTGGENGATRGEYTVKDCFVAEKSGPVVQFRRRSDV